MELFHQQGLISGNQVPFLMTNGGSKQVLQFHHQHAQANVAGLGSGLLGIPMCELDLCEAGIPCAAQCMKCSDEMKQICNFHKFHANCWAKREDVMSSKKQDEHPGSQVS